MGIKLKVDRQQADESEYLPALEPAPHPRPRRAPSPIPHISPAGEIKERSGQSWLHFLRRTERGN